MKKLLCVIPMGLFLVGSVFLVTSLVRIAVRIAPNHLTVKRPGGNGPHPLAKFGTRLWEIRLEKVAMAPNGDRFATTDLNDPNARMWDMETGALLRTFSGHTERLSSIAYSPEGTEILTGSDDHTAKLWDAETGTCLQTFVGHRESVLSVAFSPDGEKILTGSYDGTVKLWDAKTGTWIRTFEGPVIYHAYSATFSPDGTRVLVGGIQTTGRSSQDKNIAVLWDSTTGALLRRFEYGHFAAYSPDGSKILTASHNGLGGLWDATTGECLRTFKPGWGDEFFAEFSPGGIEPFVAFSPDGKRLIATSKLLDAATGKCLRKLSPPWDSVHSGGFSRDGTKMLIGLYKSANLWDISGLS